MGIFKDLYKGMYLIVVVSDGTEVEGRVLDWQLDFDKSIKVLKLEHSGEEWVIPGMDIKTICEVPENPIKHSGECTYYDSGAKREMRVGKGRCDLLPAVALLRLARHFEHGAIHYGDRNWEKGIPMSNYLDSGMRHLLKYMDGAMDEDHLCAAAWNIMCAMWTEEKLPEMQDIPTRIVKDKDVV